MKKVHPGVLGKLREKPLRAQAEYSIQTESHLWEDDASARPGDQSTCAVTRQGEDLA